MNARGPSPRRRLASALAALACLATPVFAQEVPAAPPADAASKKPSSTQNSTLRTEHKQSPVQPEHLSPQSSIAPRATTDTLMEIKRRGKLRVGVSMIIPWAMHDKDGNLIGFEIDVAKKMARDLGVDVEFYPDEFHYLIPDLLENRFDLIISGFSISTNRAMQVNFG